jgi:hypothetical protein
VGKGRNVRVAMMGKNEGRRVLGRPGVDDGMETNWLLRKCNGMK